METVGKNDLNSREGERKVGGAYENDQNSLHRCTKLPKVKDKDRFVSVYDLNLRECDCNTLSTSLRFQ